MKVLATTALLLIAFSCNAQSWQVASCRDILLTTFTSLKPLPAAMSTDSVTQGDYNSDRIPDVAMLLRPKKLNRKQSIGVCLSNVASPVLINYAYVPDHVFTKPKGTRYDDYETGQTLTYERDAISVNDMQCCGASYVLRGGVFVEIIDSD